MSKCAVVRGQRHLPLLSTALAPQLAATDEGLAGLRGSAQPEPLCFLGGTVPRPDPARTRAQGGCAPVGCPGGTLRRAPLRPSQLWGRRLPTCLPLRVVFPPELQICLGFAVIWPGERLGRPAQPAGCGPAAGESGGCGWGAQEGPPLGLGVLGNWDSAFWGISAGVIVLVSGLKHHRGVPALLLSQLSVHPGGFSVTLRGSAPTSIHFLAPWTCWDRDGPGRLGWAGDVSALLVASLGRGAGAGMTAAAAGGCGKPPRCSSRMPQTKGAGQDPASLAPAASVSPDRAVAAQPSCPGEPCGPLTAGRDAGCPPLPLTARAAPPQPASPGTPDGRDFLGKVPAGHTRLRRGRPRRWRVPLAWFCRPASGTPGDVAAGVPLTSPGVSSARGFRAGRSHPQSAGGWWDSLFRVRPAPARGVAVGLGFGVLGGNWVRSHVMSPLPKAVLGGIGGQSSIFVMSHLGGDAQAGAGWELWG